METRLAESKWTDAGVLVAADEATGAIVAEGGLSATVGATLAEVLGERQAMALLPAFGRARASGSAISVLRSFGPAFLHFDVRITALADATVRVCLGPFVGAGDPGDGTFADALASNATEMVVVFDREYRVRAYNVTYAAGVRAMHGRDATLGSSIVDLLHPASLAVWSEHAACALAGQSCAFEFPAELVNGARPTYEITLNPARRGDAPIEGVLMISRDVTSSRDRARQVSHDAALRRSLLEAMRDAVVVVAPDGTIVDIHGAERVSMALSRSEIVGKSFRALQYLPLDVLGPAFERALTSDETVDVAYELDLDGVRRYREGWLRRVSPREILFVVRDVTDARRASQHLAFASRLAALGTLAASVAHELNNPLQYVRTNLELVLEQLSAPHDRDRRAVLRDALEGLERAGTIVAGLRTFSRPQSAAREECDVARAVAAAAKLADPAMKTRGVLEIVVADTGTVRMSETQLVQVVVNLVLNARDAIEGTRGASARVRVRVAREGADHLALHVEDEGAGIPSDVLPHIFDPFFTTKAAGRGTGLGLAITSQLVHGAGGEIGVTSEPGSGSTFRVRLPARDIRPVGEVRATTTVLRVLVVDDEPLVRVSMQRVLRAHEVAVASCVDEALEALARTTFDVVLCDLHMPGRSGLDLFELLEARSPRPRFVLMTGNLSDDPRARALEEAGAVLHKPFGAAVLLRALEGGPR